MSGSIVIVELENTYTCGRTSAETALVRPPTPEEPLPDWWESAVYPLTGDGHDCGGSEDALYEAEITHAPSRPDLVGQTQSWGG